MDGRRHPHLQSHESSSGHSPKWKRHRSHRRRQPFMGAHGARYAQWIVLLIAAALLGRLAWQGMYSVLHPSRRQVPSQTAPAFAIPLPVQGVPWERDVLESIQESIDAAKAGDISAAEFAADRAASTIVVARLRLQTATPDFFAITTEALDRVVQQHPENERLVEHVADVRIELAQLRTWQKPPANSGNGPDAGSYINYGDNLPGAGGGSAADLYQQRLAAPNISSGSHTINRPSDGALAQSGGQEGPAGASPSIPGHISIGAPRALAGNQTLDPKMLGGNYLDATGMPESAEILLPPASRLMTDNIGVADLTISGAAQTLDNIRWKNVTFIGTRLRFDGGSIDLQNVHFVRCTFGFPSDARGAKLANAIALGQSSIAFE
jgi:hypothetical protein